MTELIFLKLGGSLITDKSLPYTARLDKLANLAGQIAAALQADTGLSLVLGHGSGSFGHTAAKEHGTRQGVKSRAQWRGFAEVWYRAAELNHLVMKSLHEAGVPAIALAPVSAVTAGDGRVINWDHNPLKAALAGGLVPVVYGDVVFDNIRGGTILSTEDLFEQLAQELKPDRVLLAGIEGAVWADFPQRRLRLEKITPASFEQVKADVGASHAVDVTGGMESKVRQMLALATIIPSVSIQIFSGEPQGNIRKALAGENLGTIIAAV